MTFFLAYLLTFFLTFYLAYLLTFFQAFYLAYLLTFCLAYLLTFFLTLFLAFYLAYLLTFYLTSFLTFFPLRSGSAHCDLQLAVEVRQCPLGSGARSGGPAVPTGIWTGRRRRRVRRRRRRRWRRRRRRRRRTALIKSNNPHLAGGEKRSVINRGKPGNPITRWRFSTIIQLNGQHPTLPGQVQSAWGPSQRGTLWQCWVLLSPEPHGVHPILPSSSSSSSPPSSSSSSSPSSSSSSSSSLSSLYLGIV